MIGENVGDKILDNYNSGNYEYVLQIIENNRFTPEGFFLLIKSICMLIDQHKEIEGYKILSDYLRIEYPDIGLDLYHSIKQLIDKGYIDVAKRIFNFENVKELCDFKEKINILLKHEFNQ